MNNEEQILQKLDNHDAQFEKIDQRFEKIEAHLFVHDDKFVTLENKIDKLDDSVNDVKNTLDGAVLILKKLDEEMSANHNRVSELEETVEGHTQDITLLKKQVHLTV